MISAAVLTKNEEKNIKKCLKSLKWCNEIIVIDDFSKDKTVQIAKKLGAKVYKRELKSDFSGQRNFGLKKARGEWILFLDADERIDDKLRKEINSVVKQAQKVNGFYLKRKDRFLGKWLNYGETASVKFLRLAKKDAGRWKSPIHELWEIKGEAGDLKNSIIHDRDMNISEFLTRINQYSSLRAKELYKKEVKTNAFLIMVYPVGKFMQNYFFRLGFLDAKPGFIMAVMMSIHSFLVRAKLYLLWKNKGEEGFKIPALKELYKKYG